MSEDYTEENILLAGQISNKEPKFKTMAQMDRDSAFAFHFLDILPTLKDLPPQDKCKEILKLNGQINFITSLSELSKLAAIMGDTRKRYSGKGLREALDLARNTPGNP